MDNKKFGKDDFIIFFNSLDRRDFIPRNQWRSASLDAPLSIGHGQTISQPTLVLKMSMLLAMTPDCRVLEIGTGSGYQTAFLARFSKEVYTVERIEELSMKAGTTLNMLGFTNILFRTGDGSEGWGKYAPYDRIMVTAAAGELPVKLVRQLRPGGKMVIPLGSRKMQTLTAIIKQTDGSIVKEPHETVRFVEFVGRYGW